MANRSYAQFCPVARSLDAIGERWTLLIVRQLLIAPQRFTDLRERLPGLGPSVLTERLAALSDAGLVEQVDLPPPADRTVYALTERGRQLEGVLYELARFGLAFLDLPTEEEPLQPWLVGSGLKALARVEALPDEPLTIAADLDEGPHTVEVLGPVDDTGELRPGIERLVVRTGLPDEADVTVRGSLAVLLWVRRGDLDLVEATDQGLLELEGRAAARRAVERLYRLRPDRVAARAR